MDKLYKDFLVKYVEIGYAKDFKLTTPEVHTLVDSIMLNDYVQETLDNAIADQLENMGKIDYDFLKNIN